MKYYRIRDWDRHFENNRTKEILHLAWVPVPNKHDGDGFTELMDHEDGAAHYGAWHLIVQVASKCDVRGTLLREGAGGVKMPHTPQSLARITRARADVFEAAIPRLLSIGWLECCDDGKPVPQEGAASPQEGAALLNRTELNRTELNSSCTDPAQPPARVPPHKRVSFDMESGRIRGIEDADIERLREAYPACDIRREISAAGAWLLANPTKRKKNVWGFVTRWCARSQEKGGGSRSAPFERRSLVNLGTGEL